MSTVYQVVRLKNGVAAKIGDPQNSKAEATILLVKSSSDWDDTLEIQEVKQAVGG